MVIFGRFSIISRSQHGQEKPDLGLKMTELRQQKGLKQEKLAEYCEVSSRTIQRIESGEVEPRAFTRNSLSNILEWEKPIHYPLSISFVQ